ncbi:MAG: hypothetical protein KC501_28995 [Myxococcales bacterium]|nr:hypothetical protein [Myxococcales bacterium]
MTRRSTTRLSLLIAGLGLGPAGCDEASLDDGVVAGSQGGDDEGDGGSSEASDEPGDPISLVDVEAWTMVVDPEDDPLADERPDPVDCPLATWGPEWGRLEIQTGACNYLFLRQPSLAPIDRGDALEVVVFHDALDAAEPAQGHVALLIEDEVVWEQTVDIPAEAEVLQEQIPIDESWPEGAAIGLHLHNHGYNAWTLAELTVIPRGGR